MTSAKAYHPCYKCFEEFKKWNEFVKLSPCWKMLHIDNKETVFKCFHNVHSLPKYEIFKIRYFSWMLLNNHKLYRACFWTEKSVGCTVDTSKCI